MQTPDENLEFVAVAIASEVRAAVSASFVMHAADAVYGQEQSRFKTNVGNTFTYACLYRAEATAVLTIAEVIHTKRDSPQEIAAHGKGERFPLPITIRGKAKLAIQRDMVCHPTVITWRTTNNQAFADGGHKWNAVRAGLVWDVSKEINQGLRARNLEVHVDDVPVTPEMGEMLRTILLSAGMVPTERHTGPELFAYLQRQKQSFIEILEQFPDGIIPPQPVTRLPSGL